MEAFLVSFGLVALAELGDKTQFLALMLASRFHRPVPILAGIFVAALINHLASAALGYFIGVKLNGPWLRWIIAASFFAVALWAMLPEKDDDGAAVRTGHLGVFGATVCAFFIAELGDKTEIATAALLPRPAAPQPANIEPSGKDARTLALLRRTVPELRMRRPAATVEAQVRWRAAAEARRQFRVIS